MIYSFCMNFLDFFSYTLYAYFNKNSNGTEKIRKDKPHMNLLVSACLLGIPCRYDAKEKLQDNILKLCQKHTLIPVCPEQLGGLPTPRDPSELVNDKVMTDHGIDVTAQFKRGAEECLKIAKINNCSIAILKERSPSCGNSQIYDGTFRGCLIPGMGVCAKLLSENGITVYGESDLEQLVKILI